MQVNQSRERVAEGPGYSPDLVADRGHHARVYDHYGSTPYWHPGHPYPFVEI